MVKRIRLKVSQPGVGERGRGGSWRRDETGKGKRGGGSGSPLFQRSTESVIAELQNHFSIAIATGKQAGCSALCGGDYRRRHWTNVRVLFTTV